MSCGRYSQSAVLLAAGTAELAVDSMSEWHQVGFYAMASSEFVPGDQPEDEATEQVVAAATTGRAVVQVKAYGAASFEPLTVDGVPVELGVNQTLPPFRARLAAIRLDVTGVDGAVSITASGW